MRVAEYKQTGTKTVEERYEIPAEYDEAGDLIREAYTDIITREVGIYGLVYRDMTPDEEADVLEQQREAEEWEHKRQRTPEERCDAIEDKQTATEQDVNMLADTVLALCDIIEGGEQ